LWFAKNEWAAKHAFSKKARKFLDPTDENKEEGIFSLYKMRLVEIFKNIL
jgi:hypothetical protein